MKIFIIVVSSFLFFDNNFYKNNTDGIENFGKIQYKNNILFVQDNNGGEEKFFCEKNICTGNIASLSDDVKWAFEWYTDGEADRIEAEKVKKNGDDIKIFYKKIPESVEIIFDDYE